MINEQSGAGIKVCHMSTVHRWDDNRVYQKQCLTLQQFGFDVHLIVATGGKAQSDIITLHQLREPKNRIDRIFNLTKEAFEEALLVDADVYQIHDPELLPTALKLKKLGKHVVYDAHENAPASIYDKEWIPLKPFRYAVSKYFENFELRIAKQLDGVISVAEPLIDRFENKRKILLRNLPNLTKFQSKDLTPELADAEPGVIYAGGLTAIRNIYEMIEGIHHSKECKVLHLFGDWETEAYKEKCMSSKGWSKVKFWGFRDSAEVYTFMQLKGQAGLVLFDGRIKNHQIALPNKVFEYMASGLPIIMSDIPYWKENFSNAVMFTDPQNPAKIASTIDELLTSKEKQEQMIKVGLETVKTLNWEEEFKKLVGLYLDIVKSNN